MSGIKTALLQLIEGYVLRSYEHHNSALQELKTQGEQIMSATQNLKDAVSNLVTVATSAIGDVQADLDAIKVDVAALVAKASGQQEAELQALADSLNGVSGRVGTVVTAVDEARKGFDAALNPIDPLIVPGPTPPVETPAPVEPQTQPQP